jgi:hypothetical protein
VDQTGGSKHVEWSPPGLDEEAAARVEQALQRLRTQAPQLQKVAEVTATPAGPIAVERAGPIPVEKPAPVRAKNEVSLWESWLAAQKNPPPPEETSVVLRPMVPTVAEREENTSDPAPDTRRGLKTARQFRAGGFDVAAVQTSTELPTQRSLWRRLLSLASKFSSRGLWGTVVAVGVASPAVQSGAITYYDAEHRFALQLPTGWNSTREMRFGRGGVRFVAPLASANCHVGVHPAAHFGEMTQQEIEARVATVDTKGFWTTTLEERAWSPVELEHFGTMPIGDQVLHYSISKFTTKLADRGVVPVKFRLGFAYTQGVIYSVSCMAVDEGDAQQAPNIADIFSTFRVTSPYPKSS